MFWHKTNLDSTEYLKLFKMLEEIRISVEMMKLDLELTKQKLRARKGLIDKEEENETNKKPSILLSPNGNII